jgi:hypothetical protein
MVVTGVISDVLQFFGFIAATLGLVSGAMAADSLLAGRRWAGPRAGFNLAGWISWIAICYRQTRSLFRRAVFLQLTAAERVWGESLQRYRIRYRIRGEATRLWTLGPGARRQIADSEAARQHRFINGRLLTDLKRDEFLTRLPVPWPPYLVLWADRRSHAFRGISRSCADEALARSRKAVGLADQCASAMSRKMVTTSRYLSSIRQP